MGPGKPTSAVMPVAACHKLAYRGTGGHALTPKGEEETRRMCLSGHRAYRGKGDYTGATGQYRGSGMQGFRIERSDPQERQET